MDKNERQKKINFINKLDDSSNDYDNSIKVIMDEKKHVAVDFKSSRYRHIWPSIINYEGLDEITLQNLYWKSFPSFSAFYIVPFAGTSIFSIILYPRFVFLAKRLFKLKSFISINSFCLIGLMYFNVKVFSILQTFTGFYIIKKNFELVNEKKNEFKDSEEDLGFYYHILKKKIVA